MPGIRPLLLLFCDVLPTHEGGASHRPVADHLQFAHEYRVIFNCAHFTIGEGDKMRRTLQSVSGTIILGICMVSATYGLSLLWRNPYTAGQIHGKAEAWSMFQREVLVLLSDPTRRPVVSSAEIAWRDMGYIMIQDSIILSLGDECRFVIGGQKPITVIASGNRFISFSKDIERN